MRRFVRLFVMHRSETRVYNQLANAQKKEQIIFCIPGRLKRDLILWESMRNVCASLRHRNSLCMWVCVFCARREPEDFHGRESLGDVLLDPLGLLENLRCGFFFGTAPFICTDYKLHFFVP